MGLTRGHASRVTPVCHASASPLVSASFAGEIALYLMLQRLTSLLTGGTIRRDAYVVHTRIRVSVPASDGPCFDTSLQSNWNSCKRWLNTFSCFMSSNESTFNWNEDLL